MNIDELAYQLRNLPAVDFERVFDRMTEVDKYNIQQVAFSEQIGELEELRDAQGWWNSQAETYESQIDDLKGEISDLEDENTKLANELEALEAANAKA